MGWPRLPSRSEVTAPFQSKEAFVKFLKTDEAIDGHAQVGNARWSNKDLEPTPPEQRNWNWFSMPMYWFANKFSLTGWNLASALVAVGLRWDEAFIACVLGAVVASTMVVLMARVGAVYHIGFPVACRSSMGMYGSFFFVFIRGIVCAIWYGVQTYYGAAVLSVMLRCVFGSGWNNFPNALPGSADISSKMLLAFFIVWIIQLPFTGVHPRHMHYVFTAKGIVMPLAAFGIFGWCMHEGGGIEAMSLVSKGKPRTMELGWSVMSGINVIMGGLSPLLVNQPDLARYCQKPGHAGIASGVCLFASSLITFFLGLASTTSIQAVWGVAYWNVWELLDAILDHYWTPGARAGVFFVGFAFVLGTVAHNFGANSIPFGADMTGIFPKWLTIRRGQILCSILGVVTVPWKLMSSASQFLSFLGSYNIFMAPTCAVMIVDYFYVRRGNIHVPSCYDGRKGALYWFSYGVHWLGVFAWTAGAAMGIPGLIGEYQPQAVNDAARKMYMMGWVLTFSTAAVVYAVVTSFTKIRLFPPAHQDLPKVWEWMAKDGKEGFFEEEGERGFYTSTGVATTSGEFDAEKVQANTRETIG